MDWKQLINKINCMDCMELLKQIPDNSIDLVLTDPPYGINVCSSGKIGGGVLAKQSQYEVTNWDDKIPDKQIFNEIFRISKNQIIFGGNYFIEYLKNSSCWLVWDKDNGNNDFADCELCWTSFKTATRKFKYRWQGMLQERSGANKEYRYHPTQKPLELIGWILKNYSKENDLICDPFMGSWTTARASKNLKRNFIGCEKEQKYCDIGINRLKQEILL